MKHPTKTNRNKRTNPNYRSQLRLLTDLRNMAALNRRDDLVAASAGHWEARFNRAIRRLELRFDSGH